MKQASTFVFVLVIVVNVGLAVRPASCEEQATGTASGRLSAHEVLDSLDDAQRSNALIDIEIPGATENATSFLAKEVESLWNQGRQGEALAVLENLEGNGIAPAVGIAWKKAVPSRSPECYPDVAIGGGRTGFEDSALGYDSSSGNIFVMIQWEDGWSMNISTDYGESFSETYFWSTHALADMTVVGDHAWVGYATSAGAVRIRRFHVADGTEDSSYGWVEIDNIDPDFILDLVVDSNAPDTNNRVYVVYTTGGNGTITVSYSDLTGTSFTLIPTGISFAWYGLDFAWNPYSASPTEGTVWISFIDSSPNVQVYTNTNSAFFVNEATQPFTGTVRTTGLSAYEDNVYCVFEKASGTGRDGVSYLNTSDAGAIWRIGDVYVPTSTEPNLRRPNVTVRSGAVPVVTFATDDGSFNGMWHMQRDAMSTGSWGGPASFGNYDSALLKNEIEWLDVLCVRSHGMVYGDDTGVPYFDLETERCFFGDGFESGNTHAWSDTTP